MKAQFGLIAICIGLIGCFCGAAYSAGHPHWGYEGHNGAEHWGKLDKSFELCAKGKNQSPIDISNAIDAKLDKLFLQYSKPASEILNNGHTIQMNFPNGNGFQLNGSMYELKQVHFHSPSENTINGKHFPLEAHFVHADLRGNLAVIGIMFEEGKKNQGLAKAWLQMPEHAKDKYVLTSNIQAPEMMPNNTSYYRFNGSLTTPPCSEGVLWLLMKQPLTASKSQLAEFSKTMGHANNRPVQPLNARAVIE